MKAQFIQNQLLSDLPIYTNLFHDTLAIASMSFTLATLEVTVTTTTDHGLVTNNFMNIQGIREKNLLSSLTSSNGIATAVASNRTDLTQGFQDTINISGADQLEYNGEHTLLDVIDSSNFTYSITGTPISPATGSIFLNEEKSLSYNGFFVITKIDDTTFTYTVSRPLLDPDFSNGIIFINPRIFVVVNTERALEEYTRREQNKLALFLVLNATEANRNRANVSDASDRIKSPDEFRQALINNFTISVFSPTTTEVGAAQSRDQMEDVRFFLLNSLLKKVLPTGTGADSPSDGITYVNDDSEEYTGAYLVHNFVFQVVYDLTQKDIVKLPQNVAVLNIIANYLNGFDETIKKDDIIF